MANIWPTKQIGLHFPNVAFKFGKFVKLVKLSKTTNQELANSRNTYATFRQHLPIVESVLENVC